MISRATLSAPRSSPSVLELELAGDRRQRGVDVRDPGNDHRLGGEEASALGARDDVFEQRDGQPLADAGALVDLLILPGLERHFLDHLAHERRHGQRAAVALDPGFLRRDRHRVLPRGGVVGADFRADAVLERRDDLATRRVVFRVGAEDQHDVERQPHGVAFDLDVAFLKDVEEADLHLAGQIGQLVDREHTAIGARQQPVVHGQLVGELQAGARGLDRVEVADEIGDRDVRRRELLHVARVAVEPRDRQAVAGLPDACAARRAEGRQRVIMDLAARDDRDRLVEQTDERAQDAALGLPAQAEQDEIVARQNRVDDLRHDRVVEADDPRKERRARAQALDQVAADLVLDAAPQDPAGGHLRAQLTECCGPEGRGR